MAQANPLPETFTVEPESQVPSVPLEFVPTPVITGVKLADTVIDFGVPVLDPRPVVTRIGRLCPVVMEQLIATSRLLSLVLVAVALTLFIFTPPVLELGESPVKPVPFRVITWPMFGVEVTTSWLLTFTVIDLTRGVT